MFTEWGTDLVSLLSCLKAASICFSFVFRLSSIICLRSTSLWVLIINIKDTKYMCGWWGQGSGCTAKEMKKQSVFNNAVFNYSPPALCQSVFPCSRSSPGAQRGPPTFGKILWNANFNKHKRVLWVSRWKQAGGEDPCVFRRTGV